MAEVDLAEGTCFCSSSSHLTIIPARRCQQFAGYPVSIEIKENDFRNARWMTKPAKKTIDLSDWLSFTALIH